MEKFEEKFADRPFRPDKCPFFYGWIIVGVSAAGVLMSMPGQTLGVAAFKNLMRDSLGVSDLQISRAYMIGTLASAFLLTSAGRLLDRLGARVLAPVAAVAMGLVTFLLAGSDRMVASMAFLPISPAVTATGLLVVLFFLLRFTGQGVLTLASRNMLVKWFSSRRGLATGIMGVLTQPGYAAAPYFFYKLIQWTSWQTAWLILGAIAVFVFAPLALLLYRDNPESCGVIPDGRIIEVTANGPVHEARRHYELSEARRTFPFWIIAGALMMSAFFGTAIGFHVESIFKDAGMDRAQAFASFLPGCAFGMLLRPVMGRLCDIIRLKHILRVYLSGMSLAILAIAFLSPGPMLWLYFVASGIGSSVFSLMLSVAWPNFYGRKHLGAISGFVMSLLVFASALGPWFFSKIQLYTGSYSNASLICLLITVGLLIASLWVENPQEKEALVGA